jgi:hypothetical protein
MYKGVPFSLMPTLKQHIISSCRVPAKWAPDLMSVLDFTTDMGGAGTVLDDVAYTDMNDKPKYISVLWSRDDLTGRYTLFIADV